MAGLSCVASTHLVVAKLELGRCALLAGEVRRCLGGKVLWSLWLRLRLGLGRCLWRRELRSELVALLELAQLVGQQLVQVAVVGAGEELAVLWVDHLVLVVVLWVHRCGSRLLLLRGELWLDRSGLALSLVLLGGGRALGSDLLLLLQELLLLELLLLGELLLLS